MQDLRGISNKYKHNDDSVRSFVAIYQYIFATTEPDIYPPANLIKLLFTSDKKRRHVTLTLNFTILPPSPP